MSEQEIKSLLYKDLQRYKKLTEQVNALEKQVLLMHDFLKATATQVVTIGEALTKLAKLVEMDESNDG